MNSNHGRSSRDASLRAVGSLLFAALASAGCGGSGGGDATGPAHVDSTTYAMAVGRAEHTVTSLGNGDLLIVGGVGTGGSPLGSTEVLDASLVGSSTPPLATAGSLAVARARHTATLLASGNVVAIGGASTGAIEEFTPNAATPSLGAWATAPVATLATPRRRHAAVRLLDGRVLVAGGEDAFGVALASCELYVSAGAPVAPAAPLGTARRDHTATLLPDGRVLVTGGTDVLGIPLASAELYTPGTNTWAPAANSLATARALHAAHFLDGGNPNPADDRVLLAGGYGIGGDGVAAAELFDPATDSFGPGGTLEGPAVFDLATAVLANGQVGLAGGFTSGGASTSTQPTRESIVYRLAGAGGVGAQDLPGRRGATRAGTIPSSGPAGSDLVVVGGYDESGVPRTEVFLLAIDDEATALADTLSDEEALAFGVFATGFHVLHDAYLGAGDVELEIDEDPVFGRFVTGWVGNFYVDLELDAGAITGYVEGKSYTLTVTDGWAVSPDLEVDFRPPTWVDGDMDVANEDFDFDVDRSPGLFRGWVTGYDVEIELRVEVDGDHTDPGYSYMDVYLIDPYYYYW